MSPIPFNKLCELEDFADPELAATIREVCAYKIPHLGEGYPKGSEHRKDWEVGMAVRALDRFGALGPDARVLGVGAGREDTVFYLTRRARQVFATDRYLIPGEWGTDAQTLMLLEPQEGAPFGFERDRLVVQHMDGRRLHFPDDTFDGIFSSGSIEHFGELMDSAYSAYEMGRVLKPGGVLAISTEFCLSGPPGGIGWPGRTLLFSRKHLERYVIDASGLTLADDLDTSVSDATFLAPCNPGAVIMERARRAATDPRPDFARWDFPHLVLTQGGYVFGSVHLTLVKGQDHPRVDNEWARPPSSTLAAIRRYNLAVVADLGAKGLKTRDPDLQPVAAAAIRPEGGGGQGPPPGPNGQSAHPHAHLDKDGLLHAIDQARAETGSCLERLDGLGDRIEDAVRGLEPPGSDDPPATVCRELVLDEGLRFVVTLEQHPVDDLSSDLGTGHIGDAYLLSLMLGMVGPGSRVVDLGAHVGVFSLAASALGCLVAAIEASPVNTALLRASAWCNSFHELRVFNAVVSDEPGSVQFIPNGPWGHVAWEPGPLPRIPVAAVTVDELVSELGWDRVSFIKMDIEGSEPRALAGMTRILGQADAPPVLYESNGHALGLASSSPSALIAAFEALGYSNYLVEPGRLTRITPDDTQVQTVVQCLALKRRPAGLDGFSVCPPPTLDEQVARAVAESRHKVGACRAWVATALAQADPSLQGHAAVVAALESLRSDPLEEVRSAAAWSAPRQAPAPEGGPS
jgi:FkbM family methyltransferase